MGSFGSDIDVIRRAMELLPSFEHERDLQAFRARLDASNESEIGYTDEEVAAHVEEAIARVEAER